MEEICSVCSANFLWNKWQRTRILHMNFMLGVSQSLNIFNDCETPSMKFICKILVRCHLFHKKLALQTLQISSTLLNSTLSSHYLTVRHYYSQIKYTSVSDFKLTHLCIWIHIIIISHYLPVQTHHNNHKQSFSNFFGESKEIQNKLHSIVLEFEQSQ